MTAASVELKIADQVFHFDGVREFEFALAGRTSLPYEKIAALSALSDDALLREVTGIRQLEQRFVGVVERSMAEPGAIGDFLRDLDLNVISKDYEWREIVQNVVNLDSGHEQYRKVAMVKYMQYLAARQEIVRSTYNSRHAKREGAEPGVLGMDPKKSETLIFDLTTVASSDSGSGEEFQRLPKGETVDIPIDPGSPVDVVLAKHKFSIVAGEKLCFVVDKDHQPELSPGKNIVGRDASSDVVIDANYRAVSRRHLIIEMEGASMIRLTDISSLGTFVSPEYLDRTGI